MSVPKTVLRPPAQYLTTSVEDLGKAVLITAQSRALEVACHRCEAYSPRVNSRYRRLFHDLAAGGRAAMIDLEVRRFFCGNPDCGLRTFAEQVPAVALQHQRRTPLLGSVPEVGCPAPGLYVRRALPV